MSLTMAALKARVTRAGSTYFNRGNRKFFRPEKFYGPYVGPGGIYFVQFNKSGWGMRKLDKNNEVQVVVYGGPLGAHGETFRKVAQAKAKGLSPDMQAEKRFGPTVRPSRLV